MNLSINMCAETDKEIEKMKQLRYRKIVEKILWLSLYTRPDITYATTQCTTFCNNYGSIH